MVQEVSYSTLIFDLISINKKRARSSLMRDFRPLCITPRMGAMREVLVVTLPLVPYGPLVDVHPQGVLQQDL